MDPSVTGVPLSGEVVELMMPSILSRLFIPGDSEEGRMAQYTSQPHPLFAIRFFYPLSYIKPWNITQCRR